MEIVAPADVATGVQRFLRDLGYDARADVPLDRGPGIIRVSRVAGRPHESRKGEQTSVLVEVWKEGQQSSFMLARELWARFAAISINDQSAIPGLLTYEAIPSMPVENPDVHAPRFSRHQFTVEMLVGFDKITIPEEGAA